MGDLTERHDTVPLPPLTTLDVLGRTDSQFREAQVEFAAGLTEHPLPAGWEWHITHRVDTTGDPFTLTFTALPVMTMRATPWEDS